MSVGFSLGQRHMDFDPHHPAKNAIARISLKAFKRISGALRHARTTRPALRLTPARALASQGAHGTMVLSL